MTIPNMDQAKAATDRFRGPGQHSGPDLRVLFITFCFPPDAEVGGKRVARLCRYLPEFGISPVVLTVDERFYQTLDRSYPIPGGVELVRTSVMRTPLDWYGDWARRRLEKRRQTVLSADATPPVASSTQMTPDRTKGLRAHLRALLEMPNENWAWYWHAMKAGEKILRHGDIAAVVSSAPPWTCHLIARSLKRKFGVPWIADFRDAWTFEPWRPVVPAWRDRVDSRMESSIVCEADRVTSVVEGVRDEFRAKYSNVNPEKFLTIPNGFEGEISASPPSKHSPRLILHLGSLYGGRRIDTFCEAVLRLIDRGSLTPDSLRIEFVGGIDPSIRAAAERSAATLLRRGILHFRARVPFEEGQKMLRNADLLLVFQGSHRFSVTAKVYEYFVTGTPILAVAKTGAISRLLSDTGVGVCADPDDVQAIETALLRTLEMSACSPHDLEQITRQFHFRNLAGRFADEIAHLARERKRKYSDSPG